MIREKNLFVCTHGYKPPDIHTSCHTEHCSIREKKIFLFVLMEIVNMGRLTKRFIAAQNSSELRSSKTQLVYNIAKKKRSANYVASLGPCNDVSSLCVVLTH
jgi:hypothetical protein